MKISFSHFIIIACFIVSGNCFSQQIPDSLKNYSYGELVEKVGFYFSDSTKAAPYLYAYLNKAKLENKTPSSQSSSKE